MSIQVGTHARIGAKPGAPFEYIREVVAVGDANYTVHSTVREKLCSSHLQCQKGTTLRSAARCLNCPRLVNFVPKSDAVIVRCLWTDADHVESLMTMESELVTISPTASLAEARQRASQKDVHHLLVVEEGLLIGLIHRDEMADEEFGVNTISARVNLCPWTIGPETTLAQAARLMHDRNITILPVVENRAVLGVVTRGDLRRAGVTEGLLESSLGG